MWGMYNGPIAVQFQRNILSPYRNNKKNSFNKHNSFYLKQVMCYITNDEYKTYSQYGINSVLLMY
jgi:hypothetical protein